ncbi:UDP-N-acetylglucosamine 3-dehydrogenase [Phycisphaerae bacterium]|jgi:predicted dehydrogenase|nr:UDP-N-acetylglucosamine 3-dehydrogenase [Phycisphaerae bacterium]
MSKKILRYGVVGAGRMGRHHIRLGTQIQGIELVGVVDPDESRRNEMKQTYGGEGFANVNQLIAHGVDCVVIATPTIHHRAAAEALLAKGVHCLIEKPLAPSVVEARAIADAAAKSGATLQVGHVVRYDPVMVAIRKLNLDMPRFIEIDRISPMTFRSVDVGVVLDMMIHDLDLLLMLLEREPSEVHASAVSVLGDSEDVCNARLTFAPGPDGHCCVANITASRLALKTERKIRLISSDAYTSADFVERKGTVIRKTANQEKLSSVKKSLTNGEDLSSVNWLDLVSVDQLDVKVGEPLKLQLEDFIDAIHTGRKPFADAEAGFAAVRTAERIVAAAKSLESKKTV